MSGSIRLDWSSSKNGTVEPRQPHPADGVTTAEVNRTHDGVNAAIPCIAVSSYNLGMDTTTEIHPRATEILVDQIHRLCSGHLSVTYASLGICKQSLSTIEHFLPIVRDHEDPEVRRIAIPLLAMLGMTLRNVSFAMMDTVVSPEGLRKTFEEAGVMDDDTAYGLRHYEERLRHQEWQHIFSMSQRATSETDSMPETRPQILAEEQRHVTIDENHDMVVDSYDNVKAETLLAQIADLDAARRGEARVSLETGFGYTLRVEGTRRTAFYLRVSIGDAEDRTGAAIALATAVLKAQLRRIETGNRPDRKTLQDRLRPFMEATHAAHPGIGISGEQYRLSICYPSPFHECALHRFRLQNGYVVPDSDEWLDVAPQVAAAYAALPYGYKLGSESGWKPTAGTDIHWVDGLDLLEMVQA